MAMITFIFYFQSLKKDDTYQKRAGVILAHGFSTASSIADAVNKFLGKYVFDAIDMPVNVDMNSVLPAIKFLYEKVRKNRRVISACGHGKLGRNI